MPERPASELASTWDARYAGDAYLFGTEPNAFLVETAPLLAGGARVLCVADGEGRNSTWLAEQGFAVDAFDASSVAVEKARRLAAARGVDVGHEVATVDGWRWPPAAYDAVAAIFVQFAGPPLRRRMYALIRETLVPGGLLLLQGYGLEQLRYRTGGPSAPDQLYTEEQLREELAAFAIERLVSYEREVEEGPGHSGMSALVDVVARRPASA